MSQSVIDELNTFLEGNYMAIHAYDQYIHHMDDDMIKRQLQQIQQQHKQHAALIAERIQNLGGKPVHDVGMMGKMAEFMQQMKSTTDREHILKDALVGEQRGIKTSQELMEQDLDQESLQLVESILNRDREHVTLLQNLLKKPH